MFTIWASLAPLLTTFIVPAAADESGRSIGLEHFVFQKFIIKLLSAIHAIVALRLASPSTGIPSLP